MFDSANILSIFPSDVKKNKNRRQRSYSNALPRAELPYAPFWGLNAAHREDGVFSFTPTATRKREPWG